MKVIVSDSAKEDLKNIYDYYSRKASNKVAKSVTKKIIIEIKSLPLFHNKFQDEEFLSKLNLGYKRCIVGNYKVIYRCVDINTINVTSIFDTRQDPSKIKG